MVGPLLTWLHISDIHFGHGDAEHRFDQESVTEALIRDAARLKAESIGAPDLILLTGDIAFSAQSRQYRQASDWLTRLLGALGVTHSQVLVVPGNHDVDRSKARAGDALDTHQGLRAHPNSINSYLSGEKSLKVIWPKLSAFASFAREYGSPQISARNPYWIHTTLTKSNAARPIIAVGLNTALLSYDGQDAADNLALGSGQIVRAIEKQPADALLLVLMHHPPPWLVDGQRLLAVLQQRPHLLLSGHVHAQKASLGLHLTAGMNLHFAAGAAHAGAGEHAAHAYSWGQLTPAGLVYHSRIFLPGERDYAAQPIGASAPFKRGETIVIPKDRLPPGLSRWLFGASTDATQATSPRQQENPARGPNPFQKHSTLPVERPSYIRRICDSELEHAIEKHALIVIHGDPELGKSSLRIRFMNWLEQLGRQTCYVDIQDLDLYNPGNLTQEFLERVGRSLKQGEISSWGALKSAIGATELTLFIDEFGRLLAGGALNNLAAFISGLTHFVTTHNAGQGRVRLIVCMPVLIEQFFSAVKDLHQKYTRGWHHILVPPFVETEAEQLLELLPAQAHAVTKKYWTEVIAHSRLRPRPLQCLAYELYNRCAQPNCSDAELAQLVQRRESYQ